MEAEVYQIDGKSARKVALPAVFSTPYREDLVRRALLHEQSTRYQPQGHYLLAGLNTTAIYVGRMNTWRSGRHMGQAIRPKQKLGGGSKGDVRRIPSAVKGRRAHPHKIEKSLVEEINVKEYRSALGSAIAGTANSELIKARHTFDGHAPLVIEDKIESITKSQELVKVLEALRLGADLERSHDPKVRKGLRRLSQRRHFRNSVLIIAANVDKVGRAARNIPGVQAVSVNQLRVAELAPGAKPRLAIWTEGALKALDKAVAVAKAM